MRAFVFCFLLTLSCFINSISAQSDSLITELEKTLQAQIDSLGHRHIDLVVSYNKLGEIHEEKGNYKLAINYFSRALNTDVYNQRLKQSDSLIVAELEQSLQAMTDSLGKEHLAVAMYFDSIGTVYLNRRNYSRAEALFRKAGKIRIEKLGEEHSAVATSWENLALTLLRRGEYIAALSCYEEAERITGYRIQGDYRVRITRDKLKNAFEIYGEHHLLTASLFFLSMGSPTNKISMEYTEKALAVFKKKYGNYHKATIDTNIQLCKVYHAKKEYEKSLTHAKTLLPICKKYYESDTINLFRTKLELIHLLIANSFKLENYNEIIKYAEIELKINEYFIDACKRQCDEYRLRDIASRRRSFVGTTEELENQLDIASKKYVRDKSIQLQTPLKQQADIYAWLCIAYNKLGNHEKEIECLEKILAFWQYYETLWLAQRRQRYDYMVDRARSYIPSLQRAIADAYSDMGRKEKTHEYTIEAINYIIQVNYGYWMYFSGLNAINFPNKRNVSITYDEDALIGYNKKHFDNYLYDIRGEGSLQFYKKIANIWEKHQNYKIAHHFWHQIINRVFSGYLSSYSTRITPEQRQRFLSSYDDIYNDFYRFVMQHGDETIKPIGATFLMRTKAFKLGFDIAIHNFVENANDEHLTSTYNEFRTIKKQLANIESSKINELNAKESKLNLRLLDLEDEIINIITDIEFNAIQKQYANIRVPETDELNTKESELNSAVIDIGYGTESKIIDRALHKKPMRRNRDVYNWLEIHNNLDSNEVSLDFMHIIEEGNHIPNYYVVVTHKTYSSPIFVKITNQKTLIELLNTDNAERPSYIYNRGTRQDLYKALWQPLEPYLEDIKTVHVSPAGILHRVPFESLQDTEDEYLAARYEFHYYSAIRDMLKEKPQKTTYEDMLLMGHILYSPNEKNKYVDEQNNIVLRGETNTRDSIQGLPGTLDEVTEIKHTGKKAGLKTTLLTIDAASEDTVQTFVGKHAPSIIHFATHGVFLPPLEKRHEGHDLIGSRDRLRAADNPLQRSALMLYGANETWTKGRAILGSGEDGILTALEVTALDLQNTNLVVLSACSTGLGDTHNTEGVFGLQRAFKLAGVEYVVASLWDVDDEATKDLMVEFYKNLLERKQAPATALRNAKHKFIRNGDDPELWAGFILIE